MSIKITYFVHGTTIEDNENNISSGWEDPYLSSLGIKQSEELKEKTADKNFEVAFTSDLRRAYESAQITWGDKYNLKKLDIIKT